MERLIDRQLQGIQGVLDIPFIRRIRRNHGLEHATIHLLSKQVAGLKMVGRSDSGGFWLFGDVTTDAVVEQANLALDRMRKGEHRLAIHPNCGTNLVTVGLLGAAATLVALVGSERERYGKIQRLPMIVMGIMAAVLFGQPLGMRLQEHVTTLGDPGDLEILSVTRRENGSVISHRVETRSS